jgi:hypothetical protein
MHTVQWQNAVIQESMVSKEHFPVSGASSWVIAEYSRSRLCRSLLGRAIPCSNVAQQRQKIIRKRVALRRDESVSVVTVGTGRRKQETPPMRIYIIGNDRITLCREPPAAVNADGSRILGI